MRVLVLGCKGQLGQCLKDQLRNSVFEVIYTSRDQIDITDFQGANSKIRNKSPDVIINVSAYTQVDKAEKEHVTADLINHLAVANLAAITHKLDCLLIHISSDYVFDGNAREPYIEVDKTNPLSVYGKTKLKGELAIKASGSNYLIIRTAWIFSEYENNFLRKILQLGTTQDELSFVRDQVGCPTYAQDLAKAIVLILKKHNEKILVSETFHYCGDKPCSWYDFACLIFKEASLYKIKTPRFIHSIQTSDYKTAAKRPIYSVLKCNKIMNTFGVKPSDWRQGIKNSLSKIYML